MSNDTQLYFVMMVILFVWLGIAYYLIMLDRKTRRILRELDNED